MIHEKNETNFHEKKVYLFVAKIYAFKVIKLE